MTEQHKTARREQILRAAQRCVARDGFHKTTMAAVLAEADLSAGAVYLYYTSKDQLLEAIAERTLAPIEEMFTSMLADDAAPDLSEALLRVLEQLAQMAEDPDGDVTVIAIQAWAEAALGGPIHTVIEARVSRLREWWAELARRQLMAGRLEPGTDPAEVAQVMLGMVPGFVIQRLLVGGVTPASYVGGLRSLHLGPSLGTDERP